MFRPAFITRHHDHDHVHTQRQRSTSPPLSLSSISSSSPSFDSHIDTRYPFPTSESSSLAHTSKVCPLCDDTIYGSATSGSYTAQDALEEHVDLCRMRRLRSTGSRWSDSPEGGGEEDRMFESAASFSISGMGGAAEFGGFGASIEPAERSTVVVPRSFNSRRRQLLGRAGLRRRHPKDVK